MTEAYYNENNPHAAAWLKNLIARGLIPHGDVDDRDIRAVSPADLHGYSQCHFFAGIGGWGFAARLAGWPDARPLWTGSCPCQPFSQAGRGKAEKDERHLWPEFHRLIAAGRPAVVMGEQVAGPLGLGWLAGVQSDLDAIDYASRAVVIPACAVGAPHRRERLWWIAERRGQLVDANGEPGVERRALIGMGDQRGDALARPGFASPSAAGGAVADCDFSGSQRPPEHDAVSPVWPAPLRHGEPNGDWHGSDWITCADDKSRRIKPGLCLLVDGLPGSVAGSLSGYGNAIVPQVAAAVLRAYLEK
jgi:DNA (cytosine-5)-methyltransferase 1